MESVLAPRNKHELVTLERIDKFISKVYFKEINLTSMLLVGDALKPDQLTHFACDTRFGLDHALSPDAVYEPAKVGDVFGPIWSTHWFKVSFPLPLAVNFESKDDLEVLFCWNSTSEATLWDAEAKCPIGAFSDGGPFGDVRDYIVLSDSPYHNIKKESGHLEFLLEMACNTIIGNGDGTFIGPPNSQATYSLAKCEIRLRNKTVYKLINYIQLLHDLAKELDDSDRGRQALFLANHCINLIQMEGPTAYPTCMSLCSKYFSTHSASGTHMVHAVGHCHMDCAWLWPYDETKRKCARSWSATLELMGRYPEMKFACSSAQQYAWIEEFYPPLFSRIRDAVARRAFIPVGGSWVEMDGNLPDGESMCRQLLLGQRYFMEKFGIGCQEFWLPDTFGYSPQLPQIIKHFGMTRFFTQKISWNIFNKFPHHTFHWKGLDGTTTLAHFAPGDSYHMQVSVSEILKTSKSFKDKGRSNDSLFLYGHGDGGQGPTQDMLENLSILVDVNGLPKVNHSTPNDYFMSVERHAHNLCTWSGELYLEMHNGTYTTQAKIKEYNRRLESELNSLEFLAAVRLIQHTSGDPKRFIDLRDEINSVWKEVLLNQFHDVLPGSSIQIVNEEAISIYERCTKECDRIKRKLLHLESPDSGSEDEVYCPVNACGSAHHAQHQTRDGEWISVEVPPFTIGAAAVKVTHKHGVVVDSSGRPGAFTVQNKYFKLVVDKVGRITDLHYNIDCHNEKTAANYSRNLVKSGCVLNQVCLYDDIPLFWDAWDIMDYHQETRRPVDKVLSVTSLGSSTDNMVTLNTSLEISANSRLTQIIRVESGSPYVKITCQVDWNENRKLLKAEFPLDINSDHVTYETQFGHHRRPTHRNTSWDSAKFEVCCQRWMDLSDYNCGVAILNDSKYGCSVNDNSTLSLSLLRSPKYPDAVADIGSHTFSYAVMPHQGSFQSAGVIEKAIELNASIAMTSDLISSPVSHPVFTLSSPQVIVSTVKIAEHSLESSHEKAARSTKPPVVVRLYEAYGGSCTATISVNMSFSLTSVFECDGLENRIDPQRNLLNETKNSFTAEFTPFKVKTFQLFFD